VRVYFTTTIARADEIWREGWTDRYKEFGRCGVYASTKPLNINDGFSGDVTLCLDVPEGLLAEYDVTDEVQASSGYRLFLVPAAVLTQVGTPQVYDHVFAGPSRRELLTAIRCCEADAEHEGNQTEGLRQHIQSVRDAIKFFDQIGWLTPLKLQEQQAH
jgi:hypothetical protein